MSNPTYSRNGRTSKVVVAHNMKVAGVEDALPEGAVIELNTYRWHSQPSYHDDNYGEEILLNVSDYPEYSTEYKSGFYINGKTDHSSVYYADRLYRKATEMTLFDHIAVGHIRKFKSKWVIREGHECNQYGREITPSTCTMDERYGLHWGDFGSTPNTNPAPVGKFA